LYFSAFYSYEEKGKVRGGEQVRGQWRGEEQTSPSSVAIWMPLVPREEITRKCPSSVLTVTPLFPIKEVKEEEVEAEIGEEGGEQ